MRRATSTACRAPQWRRQTPVERAGFSPRLRPDARPVDQGCRTRRTRSAEPLRGAGRPSSGTSSCRAASTGCGRKVWPQGAHLQSRFACWVIGWHQRPCPPRGASAGRAVRCQIPDRLGCRRRDLRALVARQVANRYAIGSPAISRKARPTRAFDTRPLRKPRTAFCRLPRISISRINGGAARPFKSAE